MEEITQRINQALANEEVRAERFANSARLTLIIILSFVAVLNAGSITFEANLLNFGALLLGYTYGTIVFLFIRRIGYRPIMKYITSCIDIVILFLLLYMYTTIEIPTVALKHYIFMIAFPLIMLTVFRYDRKLTMLSGGLTIVLYIVLIIYLAITKAVTITNGGYYRELFSDEITLIGQLTKVLILVGFVALASYLTKYTRRLLNKLIRVEVGLLVQKESTDLELEIASQVQRKLLPHQLPAVRGLEIFGKILPGKFVAGDYSDFIKLSETSLLTVVADVSGKGVPAALIMSEVRASTHLLASMGLTLEEFVRRLNGLLYESTDKKDFVTFFIAVINTTDGTIQYVNAGHPPPLIYLNNAVRLLSERTLPLGALAILPQFPKTFAEFPTGSVAVLYTDGILERTNPEGEQYGEERLHHFIQDNADNDVQTLVQKLLGDVKSFGMGKDLDDDVTLAIIRHD